jgi:serine/threonine protein kinase
MRPLPRIPGYELLHSLGGGPLTCVYAAHECSSDSPCAVKVIRDDWKDQATALQLLQREARVGLAVRHPHVVRFRRAHVTRPPYFLVMDLVAGESVRDRLRRTFQLEVRTALWIARQTAEALAALHRAGFVHGDVKPDNIRLVNDGTAILIDLGFAHRPGENAHFREAGYVLGTTNYLAPELCDPDQNADQGTDLFSLGVTLFEMISGHFPYPPGSLVQTIRRHAADPPADIGRLAGPLPTGLVQLIGRLLDRRPSARPHAAAVVAQLIALEIATLGRESA